jgi:hypothetical protein
MEAERPGRVPRRESTRQSGCARRGVFAAPRRDGRKGNPRLRLPARRRPQPRRHAARAGASESPSSHRRARSSDPPNPGSGAPSQPGHPHPQILHLSFKQSLALRGARLVAGPWRTYPATRPPGLFGDFLGNPLMPLRFMACACLFPLDHLPPSHGGATRWGLRK